MMEAMRVYVALSILLGLLVVTTFLYYWLEWALTKPRLHVPYLLA